MKTQYCVFAHLKGVNKSRHVCINGDVAGESAYTRETFQKERGEVNASKCAVYGSLRLKESNSLIKPWWIILALNISVALMKVKVESLFWKLIITDRGKYFVNGTTSMPLNTHVFIPPVLLLSIRHCASNLKCPSHGQPSYKLSWQRQEKTCRYTGLFIWMYCAFVDVLSELDLSAVNLVLSHAARLAKFQDVVALKNVTLTWNSVNIFEVQLSGWKDDIHHTFVRLWSQNTALKCYIDTVERSFTLSFLLFLLNFPPVNVTKILSSLWWIEMNRAVHVYDAK